MLTRLLARVSEAFAVARPDHFVGNPTHCSECQEHERTLSSVTPDSISFEDVGYVGGPLCFATNDALDYFMPGLARLSTDTEENYFLGIWLFFLELRAPSFNPSQKRAIADVLQYLYFEMMSTEIDVHGDTETLGRLVANLTMPADGK